MRITLYQLKKLILEELTSSERADQVEYDIGNIVNKKFWIDHGPYPDDMEGLNLFESMLFQSAFLVERAEDISRGLGREHKKGLAYPGHVTHNTKSLLKDSGRYARRIKCFDRRHQKIR